MDAEDDKTVEEVVGILSVVVTVVVVVVAAKRKTVLFTAISLRTCVSEVGGDGRGGGCSRGRGGGRGNNSFVATAIPKSSTECLSIRLVD